MRLSLFHIVWWVLGSRARGLSASSYVDGPVPRLPATPSRLALASRGGERDPLRRPKFPSPQKLWSEYTNLCETRPLLTKAVTASLLTGTGDVLSQSLLGQARNWLRTLTFFLVGLLYEGLYFHHWYNVLQAIEARLQRRGLGRRTTTAVQVAVDQSVGVFLFFPVYFYVFELLSSLLGWQWPDWRGTTSVVFSSTLLQIIRNQYALWIPTNYVIFSRVRPSLRVFVSGLVNLGWNVWVTHRVSTSMTKPTALELKVLS